MNNVLLDPLPTDWESPDGHVYPLDTDFRIGIQLCLVQDDIELSEREKIIQMQKLLFVGYVPPNPKEVEECLKFFLNGWHHDNSGRKKEKKRLMDFDIDQWRIYSAFLAQYHIDLNTVPYMHFWMFMGLLSSLQECSYTRVIDIRQRKFKPKMSAEEKKQLREAKDIYELPELISLEDQEMEADISDFLGGTMSEAEKKRVEEFEKYADIEEDDE